MPLFARAFAMHYPARERSPRLDHHIALCGGLEVGGFYRIGSAPSEGRWSCSGNAHFIAGGNASRMPDANRLGDPPAPTVILPTEKGLRSERTYFFAFFFFDFLKPTPPGFSSLKPTLPELGP